MTSEFPARSAMWRYRGTFLSAAPALQTARDTPRIAFAPNLAGWRNQSLFKICIKTFNENSFTSLLRRQKLLVTSRLQAHTSTFRGWNTEKWEVKMAALLETVSLHLFSVPSRSIIIWSILSCSTTDTSWGKRQNKLQMTHTDTEKKKQQLQNFEAHTERMSIVLPGQQVQVQE